MRALILVAGAALAVAACSSNDTANNTMNVDENLATDMNATDMNATNMNAIAANDVTAIDAVTGDAANMAADVNYADFGNDLAGGDSNASARASTRPGSSTVKPKPRQPDEPASSPPPIANTTANNTQ